MKEILNKIQNECDKQDAKWGSDRNLHPLEWACILGEEVGEVQKELNDAWFNIDKINLDNYEAELIQVAAVACQTLKNINYYKKQQSNNK